MDAHVRAVLEERARALARPVTSESDAGTIEVVTFVLANEAYAVESRYVIEVFRLVDLALLPGAAPPVFGITAWRGGLLTVLDLRPLLGVSAAALNDLSRVLVLGATGRSAGILADAVEADVRLRAATVREPPDGVAAQREYLLGVTGDAVLVLDAGKLLRLHA